MWQRRWRWRDKRPCVPAPSLITSVTQGESSSPTCRGRSLRGGGHGELAYGRIQIHVQQRTGSRLLPHFHQLGFFVFLARPRIELTVRPCSAGTPGSIGLRGFLGFRPGDLCGTSTYTRAVGGWRTTTCCSTGRAHVFPETPLGTCVHSGGGGPL